MSNDTAPIRVNVMNAGAGESMSSRVLKSSWRGLSNFFIGIAILFVIWWFGIFLISSNPSTEHFADFGPIPALKAMPVLWEEGTIQSAILSSGYRLGSGLLIAICIGVPIGILMGRSRRFRELSNSPFQLLRMISPLSWEPIAVIVFATWNQGDNLSYSDRIGVAGGIRDCGRPGQGGPCVVQGSAKSRRQTLAYRNPDYRTGDHVRCAYRNTSCAWCGMDRNCPCGISRRDFRSRLLDSGCP